MGDPGDPAGGLWGRGRRGRRRQRLSRSAEFDRAFREGDSHSSKHLVVYSFPRADEATDPRLGVSVGRRLGNAVERNRVKRLLREAFWSLVEDLPQGSDYVLVARPDAGPLAQEGGEAAIEGALRALLTEAGLTHEEPS